LSGVYGDEILTQPVPENTTVPPVFSGHDFGNGRSSPLSVLCVYTDPLFLDRIRRNLEQSNTIFVEIAFSVEDALRLMDYLFFDAVVTDITSWHGEPNGFLKAMRDQGINIPFIYFIREPETGSLKDARQFCNVRYLLWGKWEISPPFDELAWCINEAAAAPGLAEETRKAYGWPRLTSERLI
jgi:DNA-binding NtrC family response regulator